MGLFGCRAEEAEGMLYSSRSRPGLTHLVLFSPPALAAAGAPLPFPA